MLGSGVEGLVVKAKHRESKTVCAIKRIACSFDKMAHMRYLLREITILRQLSEMKGLIYAPRLIDIVFDGEELSKCTFIFLITEYVQSNLR